MWRIFQFWVHWYLGASNFYCRPLILWHFASLVLFLGTRHTDYITPKLVAPSIHKFPHHRTFWWWMQYALPKPSKYSSFAFGDKLCKISHRHLSSQLIGNYLLVNHIENSCHILSSKTKIRIHNNNCLCNIMWICVPWFLICSKNRTYKILKSCAEENIWM
jgi:hypothetical protein